MGLFDIFKKKNIEKEEVEFVSYSHTTEDGQFMESYGYNMNNSAEDFFNNLNIKELDKIRQLKLKELISNGDVVETLAYISELIKKEILIRVDEYEPELRRQVEELERSRRGVEGDMSWLNAKVAFQELANQLNWAPYISPFKIDSYISLDWEDIEHSPWFHFSGSSHCDIITIGLVKNGKYANQLFIRCFNDGYPSGISGSHIDLLPEKNQSYIGVKEYCYGRDFVIDRDVITEETFNEKIKELYNEI